MRTLIVTVASSRTAAIVRLACRPAMKWLRSAIRAEDRDGDRAADLAERVEYRAGGAGPLGRRAGQHQASGRRHGQRPTCSDRDDQQGGEQWRSQRRDEHHPGQPDHHRGQAGNNRDADAEPVDDRSADQVADDCEQR
jgi:hypothetical protein